MAVEMQRINAPAPRVQEARGLALYEAACRALAEAKAVDEVKGILDAAVAMRAYAKQAKNRDLEADAVEIRLRAMRRLDQMRQAQKETVGLNAGARGGGNKSAPRGSIHNPRDTRPTLAGQGIDKALAHQGRVLGRLSDDEFEERIAEARASAARTYRRIVRAVELEEEREANRARTSAGCTVADLEGLAASGQRFAVIHPDPPWPWDTLGPMGRIRSCADHHYDLSTIDQIKALPVAALAADDCVLMIWGTWPRLPDVLDVIKAWGFTYKTAAFVWVKQTANGNGIHTGMGYYTRSNTEVCFLATKGSPRRLALDVHQVIIAPVGQHSEKPEEARRRIERLFGGPYLELYARAPVPGWTCWGNEIAPADMNAEAAP